MQTSDSTIERVTRFAEACGKKPVQCNDVPGFLVNRISMPTLVEAILSLERGDGTAEDIDRAIRMGMGHPVGPLQLADFVGLVRALGDVADLLGRRTGVCNSAARSSPTARRAAYTRRRKTASSSRHSC